DGVEKDYIKIDYAGGDCLYVPATQLDMVSKYIGGGEEDGRQKLNKLGGTEWAKQKTRARKAVKDLAKGLIALYAQRQRQPGFAFSPDSPWQREFEESFPYAETDDQLRCIAEIKADMEKPRPMDRLLCGDVGYGKTEVALRAVMKCILDGKQAAILVPTTVLAQQHYATACGRFRDFPVKIEVLSRFTSPGEARRILGLARTGGVDLLIGTHKLLQKSVEFKDLGLLIIDEEQRFGVAQKEKIKQWKQGIDVLALSATPIPRTLHMALVNTRDMSVIESPPEDRLPVETYVAEYSDGMVKEALERELRRGGRIYYVHNRISGLASIAARLRRLVPGIKIRVGHGRMSEEALEDAMMDFYEGRCDVLLSTTIIENGLDVPMANTIIIEGAENFGLSQLYQMRGRVGRSSRLAYAYFTYKKDKVLSEVAAKRLQAIRDFTELGAGFKIAMRDLEIRGAGNLLGPQQHGYIAGIGFAAYCDMLEQTIRRLRNHGRTEAVEPDPVLEIPLNAYIPDAYISNPRYKLELYRRFVDLHWGDADNLMDEIIDRFGTPPEEVEELWHLAQVRALCRRIGILRISVRSGMIRIIFLPKARADGEYLIGLVQLHAGRMQMHYDPKGNWLTYRTAGLELEPLTWLEKELPRWIV
ncbi:MAG TPA: transcription-repair coupling factor, partial [Acidaminococcaceae bacterium]|nr:transcription-repair coupling factor [Acidaminococcaceae bacterium]